MTPSTPLPEQGMNPIKSDDELTKTMMGQLIAELMRWHGDNKESSSRLASILLPHINALIRTEQKKLLAAVGERVIGGDEPGVTNVMIAAEHAKQRAVLQQLEEVI